jgi:Zn-finger nucleic acid-binding protein
LFINIVICPPYSSIWIDNGAFVLNKRYPKQKAQPRDTGNSRHNPEIQATEGKTQRYRQQKAQPRDTGNSMHNPEIQATVGTTQSYRQQ